MCGMGEVIPEPDDVKDSKWSQKFQWLPADFRVDKETGKVETVSYINNLHPQKFSGLYTVIEDIIEKAIPLRNRTLLR